MKRKIFNIMIRLVEPSILLPIGAVAGIMIMLLVSYSNNIWRDAPPSPHYQPITGRWIDPGALEMPGELVWENEMTFVGETSSITTFEYVLDCEYVGPDADITCNIPSFEDLTRVAIKKMKEQK